MSFPHDVEADFDSVFAQGGIVLHYNLDIERHANKIYTRTMFEQFGQNLYKGFAYRVEEIEKGKLYIAWRKNGAQIQKWCKTEFMVEVKGDNEEFDCECGLYNHMGILCGHALKVLLLFTFL
jgi:hypothetical protein